VATINALLCPLGETGLCTLSSPVIRETSQAGTYHLFPPGSAFHFAARRQPEACRDPIFRIRTRPIHFPLKFEAFLELANSLSNSIVTGD